MVACGLGLLVVFVHDWLQLILRTWLVYVVRFGFGSIHEGCVCFLGFVAWSFA